MKKEYINQFAVVYNYLNRVSVAIFAGSIEEAHEFVANLVDGMQEVDDNCPAMSSIEIIDLSQGFYRSQTYDELLEDCTENGMFQKIVEIDQDNLFDESAELFEGTYYFTQCNIAEHYQYTEHDLSDTLYPM